MYICIYVYICIYIYICYKIHTYIHTYIHACMHTYIRTCTYAYIHTCMHAYMHTSRPSAAAFRSCAVCKGPMHHDCCRHCAKFVTFQYAWCCSALPFSHRAGRRDRPFFLFHNLFVSCWHICDMQTHAVASFNLQLLA